MMIKIAMQLRGGALRKSSRDTICWGSPVRSLLTVLWAVLERFGFSRKISLQQFGTPSPSVFGCKHG